MQHLLYRSRAAERLDSGEVFRIIATSAQNNPGREVTGFLVFSRDTFLQLVEGPADKLDELLATLREDPRHRELEIIHRAGIGARSFPEWRMERLAVVGDNGALLAARLNEAGIGSAIVAQVMDDFGLRRAA